MALGIVGADLDAVRSSAADREQMIVLRPTLEDLAASVSDDDAAAELGFLPGHLLGERAYRSVEIRLQRLGQFDFPAADQVDAIRRLDEDTGVRCSDVSGAGKAGGPCCDIVVGGSR